MKKNFGLGIWVVLVSLVFAYLMAPSSLFAAYFIGLGDLPGGITYSQATGISADGSVVVGYSYSASDWSEAFRWDATNGMVGLGDLPGGTTSSAATGVSADGSIVVGGSDSGFGEAFRWDVTNGMVGLGALTDPGTLSYARAVSGDGSVVVGLSYTSLPIAGIQAFRWDATNGMVGLGDLSGGAFRSEAYGASADGSVIVGFSDSGTDTLPQRWEAFRWDATNGMVGLGFLPNWPGQSVATAVSADGSVVVGYGGSGREAFRWDATNGMVSLGQLPSGSTYSQANGVSADGSVVVGATTTVTINRVAFRWDPVNGMQIIAELLESEDVDLTGWALLEAYGVSADGSTIVGYGINPDGFTEAWVANISVGGSDLATFAADFGRTDCSGDCEGDFDTDGDVDGLDLAEFAEARS